jgi:all-trans-retinol 13,14-reductase
MIQQLAPPMLLSVMATLPFWVWIVAMPFVAFGTWMLWPLPSSKISPEELHPIRASPFHPDRVPKGNIDTIVIGSGSGGCAVANLLAQSGQRVLVLEQHDRTGGCTHSFQKHGCEWDTGLHYTSISMGTKTCRPGALINFMTKGLQKWTPLKDPYDGTYYHHEKNAFYVVLTKSSYYCVVA